MEGSPDAFDILQMDTSEFAGPLESQKSSQSLYSDDTSVGLSTPGAIASNTPKTPMALPRQGAPLTPRIHSSMDEMNFHIVHRQEAGGKHQRRCLDLAKQSFKCISDARGNTPCGYLFDNYMMCRRYGSDDDSRSIQELFPS
eukprot:32770_1